MQKRIKQAVAGAALLVATTLGAIAPAQAAVYRGTWDPPFGATTIFPDLGWSGTADFFAPDACQGVTGTRTNANPGCGGGQMHVISAEIKFWDIADPSTILQTLTVTPSAFINGMTFQSNGPGVDPDLLGVNTGFFDPVQGTIPEAKNYWFHLFFDGDDAFLAYTKGEADTPTCIGRPHDENLCGVSQEEAHVTFTPAIPEPSTYALFGVGLAALWSMRRRLTGPAVAARGLRAA